jgi:hypothetical protein
MDVVNMQVGRETLGQRIDDFQYLLANGTRGGIMEGWDTNQIEVLNQI